MAENKKIRPSLTLEDIEKDRFILELALAGVSQATIREIVGVDMFRVSRIVKHIKKNRYGNPE